MPIASTGATANALTFLSAYGETVARLDDGNSVRGIFRWQREKDIDPNISRIIRTYRYHVPTVYLSTAELDSRIQIGLDFYNVAYIAEDEDGWHLLELHKLAVTTTGGFSHGFSSGFDVVTAA